MDKKAEQQKPSQLSSDIARIIIENTSDLVAVTAFNPQATFLYANNAYERLLGYAPEELIGSPSIDFIHHDDKKNLQPLLAEYLIKKAKQLLTGKEQVITETVEYRIKDKKGVWHDFEATANIVQNNLIFIAKDITRRKSAETALALSEAKYRDLYEGSRDGWVRVALNGKIEECNNSFINMLGYPKDELFETVYQDITPSKWHEMEAEIIETQVKVRGYSNVFEKEYVRSDGEVFPVELRAYLIKDANGISSGMWAFVKDITERKKAEKFLKENQEALRLKLEEVEKFNKIAVGREIKMMELKKEIHALHEEINHLKGLSR